MFDEKSKIRRILYSFNIRKAFTHIRRFARPKEDPFAKIGEFFSSLFPKPKEEIKFKGKVVKYRTPIFRTILYFLVVVIFLGLGFYFITNYHFVPYTPPVQPPPPVPVINANITVTGSLDSFDSQRWYAVLAMSGTNLDYANISLLVFKDFAPEDVFILRSVKKDATSYDEFKKALKSFLEADGMSVTEITIDDLLRMPNASKIVLIVPTGYLPSFFLGQEDPNFDMMKFAQRGNVVIYIGRSPAEHMIARNGSLVDIPIDQIENATGLSFTPISGEGSDKFKPLYRVQQSGASKADVRSQIDAASVTWGSGGYAYFIPTTLDSWWNYKGNFSGNKSSEYIATTISDANWGYNYALGAASITAKNSTLNQSNITIFTEKQGQRSISERINNTYGRMFIKTAKLNDGAKAGRLIQVQFQNPPNGKLINTEKFVSSSITGENLQITYSLNERTLREEQIFLKIVNSQNNEVRAVSLGIKPLQIREDTYLLSAALPSGNYILRIEDSSGNSLAQSYLYLSPFSIEPQNMGWDLKLFVFNVYPEGETKNPYTGPLKSVNVSLDGREEKEIQPIGGRIAYETSFFPSPGPHTFKFLIGDDVIIKDIPFNREPSFIEKYWYMLVVIVVVFGGAFAIRRPEKSDFFIDVPDFPPLQAIAIPLKRETVLNMFDSINKELRWQYTPLSIQDLKAAFRKISFQGRPVMIGDYNLEHILDRLVEEGSLKHAIDYYGLTSWEKDSKKNIYVLAMQRALRDLFVIEGVPFIPFGQRTDCDTITSVGGEKIFLHIYEDDSVVYKAVQTASQGRSVLVFEDEQTMKDFTARIHASSETNVIFKMLLDDPNGNIFLTPINKLIEVLNKKYTFFYY